MAKMIQVRNVPDRLHRELTRRARARGLTLTQYAEQILEREAARPTPEELFERLARRPPVKLTKSVAAIIRDERRKAGS